MADPAYRRMRPEERREQILAAALSLIAVSGYDGVALEDFATAAGVTKAGLLHYFSSKEQLLIAVLERRDELDQAAGEIPDMPATDAAGARKVMDQVVSGNMDQQELIRLFTVLSAAALDPAHPAHEYYCRRQDRVRTLLTEQLFAWHTDPEDAAVELMGFLDGLQLNWLRDPTIDFQRHWASFADRLFGVRPGSTDAP